jgi:1-acyl-sn-glycerol-3-phosphate acyltransferase
MLTRMMWWIFNTFYVLLTNRDIKGLEHLPSSGPYILVANHMSYFDAPLLYSVMGGPDVTGWAANKYRRHPLFGWIVRIGGGIFIRRGQVDRDALLAAAAWLKQGKIFGISPEGTRSKTNSLARGKTGTAYLAHLTNSPIIPVGIYGTEKLLQTLSRFRRPTVAIRIGEPFRLPPLSESKRSADLREQTDEIMCRIAVLLPPAYHGVYGDHPRLKELLGESNLS